MAAWVIRQEREGEPVDAFQVEEIEVPEPGAFEVIVPDMAARLAAQGFEADNPKPRDTAKFIDAEIAKWGKVIKEGGIKGD